MVQAVDNPTYSLAPEHLEIISAVTLRPMQTDELWQQEVGHLIEVGSGEITVGSTLTECDAITSARHEFAAKLGLTQPDHELHHAYRAIMRAIPRGLKPIRFLGTMEALTDIGGDINAATQLAKNAHFLLRHTAQSIQSRYSSMQKLAAVLGWNGDVDDFIREKPKALMIGQKKLMTLGRLAARFGQPEHKDISHQRLHTILKQGLELHLAGLIQRGPHYNFGQTVHHRDAPSGSWQEYVYQKLADRRITEHVGYDVLRAYFRHSRPSAATLKKYPYLAFLQQGRAAEKVTHKSPRIVHGDEPWLKRTSIPTTPRGRKGWLTKINNCIELGSRPIKTRHANDPIYEEVLHNRIMFFRLLGWTSPATELGKAYDAFAIKYHSLVFPDRVVKLFNLLVQYDVKLNDNVLASLFYASRRTSEWTGRRIERIAARGLDVKTLIEERPSVLYASDAITGPVIIA